MTERPILFSGAMVRALLDGSKTQTRRVMKPQPAPIPGEPGKHWWPSNVAQSMCRIEDFFQHPDAHGLAGDCCPYGRHGDRLWVRETWHADPEDDGTWAYTQWAGCKGSPLSDIPKRFQKPEHCIHRATWTGSDLVWRPSIHMPRWASRILLEIVSVRVERLQDISEADCLAEGIHAIHHEGDGTYYHHEHTHADPGNWCDPDTAYQALWESINGAGSWDANPWVWVVEFKQVMR